MKYLLIAMLLLSGCANEAEQVVKKAVDCSKNTKELAQFVVDCSKAANPLSDEEGEDLVRQCHATGNDLFCTVTEQIVMWKAGKCYEASGKLTRCY